MVRNQGPAWDPPRVDPNSPTAYVYYFASVSGKEAGQRGAGPRWTTEGNLPPDTEVTLHLRWIRSVDEALRKRTEQAVRLWLCLGAMGSRVTRGLGAFQCREFPLNPGLLDELESELQGAGFVFRLWRHDLASWHSAVVEAGRVLKESLRKQFPAGKNGNNPTPLGTSQPRQTSAVYLRPIKLDNGSFGLVLFEAPAAKVLGSLSRRGAPALSQLPAGPSSTTEAKGAPVD